MFRFMATRLTLPLIAACAIATHSVGPAHAGLEMRLQSGADTFTQSGSSPLMVVQPIGNFAVTVNTGTSTTAPSIDLSSVDISNDAGGALVITLSADGFTSPTGAANWLSQFSGNFAVGSATVTLRTYLDGTNTLMGTGTALSTLTSSSTPFALADVASASTLAPFALTEVLTITTPGAAHLSLDASLVYAPEPASLALLGSGICILGALVHRRREL